MKEFTLSPETKELLLIIAREAIESDLHKRQARYPEILKECETQCGVFVTLRKHGHLRGCIGNMQGTGPLHVTVKEMALSAAFHDPRFSPVSAEEIREITIEITVLTPMTPCSDYNAIEVGRDGLYIRKGRRTGVLLPQVPVEQGWDRETFLRHTCGKAGLSETCWQEKDTELYTFQGIIFGEEGRA